MYFDAHQFKIMVTLGVNGQFCVHLNVGPFVFMDTFLVCVSLRRILVIFLIFLRNLYNQAITYNLFTD